MLEAPEIFARIYARHGHRCPMSTLGGRLGLAAVKFAGGVGDGLTLIYGSRTCALDGLAETTGCTEDDGRLTVKSDGSHVLQVVTAGGRFRLELTAEALALAGRYRALCNRLEQGWDDLEEQEQVLRKAEMDAMLDDILPQLWQMADEEVVKTIF